MYIWIIFLLCIILHFLCSAMSLLHKVYKYKNTFSATVGNLMTPTSTPTERGAVHESQSLAWSTPRQVNIEPCAHIVHTLSHHCSGAPQLLYYSTLNRRISKVPGFLTEWEPTVECPRNRGVTYTQRIRIALHNLCCIYVSNKLDSSARRTRKHYLTPVQQLPHSP